MNSIPSDSGEEILIKPKEGIYGSTQHYYHFLFDLCIPLHEAMSKFPDKTCFQIKDRGPMNTHLRNLFGQRIKIVDDASESDDVPSIILENITPETQNVKVLCSQFRQFAAEQLNVDLSKQGHKLVFVKRGDPPNFYNSGKSEKKGGGIERRSIQNHDAVFEVIESVYGDLYTCINIELEKLSLADQVATFNEAEVVIAQHGAGLANIVFMREEGRVYEINHYSTRKMFRDFSCALDLGYEEYEVDQAHVQVDLEQFREFLKSSM